jgi:hypothetical protein
MIKEFEINDILNAVNNISKIKRKRTNTSKIDVKKSSIDKEKFLTENNNEILVLDKMIE